MSHIEPELCCDDLLDDPFQPGLEANDPHSQEAYKEGQNRPKRIACILCRKRKLRCDGVRPSCATCKRLSHACVYDEVRRKSGPKRGYVKLLEQRLQQVETLLKNQDSTDATKDGSPEDSTSAYVASTIRQGLPSSTGFQNASNHLGTPQETPTPDIGFFHHGNSKENQQFSWEMIGLGLEEPLPPQEVMDDLYGIYFSKIHQSLPIIHRLRFRAALNLAPHMRPPVCLRYIMWTLAASITDKYEALQEHFYQRARKYAQMDEMKGHGISTITLAHCQMWILSGTYEFKQMYFPRAWLSAGRAVRLAQMMQLHRLDGSGLDVKQCLPPSKDWTEREERRRTFWMAFCIDRYASIGTGWPMTIDERDIMTNLPASEDAFDRSKPMPTTTLSQALSPSGAAAVQPFGYTVLTAAMFGRNLLHLHRPEANDIDDDINGGFWNRHRSTEQTILQTLLDLPDSLRLPMGVADPNVVFANMCIHTSSICLHQAAIFKADKYQLPANVSNESKIRCISAAAQITSIMRMISHMDLAAMNPFISFCVYVAARVFIQYLRTRPKDQQINSSVQFLVQAMHALRRKNPLTESFLVQMNLDLESAGLARMQSKPYASTTNSAQLTVDSDSIRCSSVIEPRETQNPNVIASTFGGNRTAINALLPFQDIPSSSPLQMSNTSITDTKAQSQGFLPIGLSHGVGMTQTRSTCQDFAQPGLNFPDRNDVDMSGDRSADQPSPATISSQSRGDSTSHSSYSPAQTTEHHLPYRATVKFPSSHSAIASATAFPESGFTTSSEVYANSFGSFGIAGGGLFRQTFSSQDDWDFNAMSMGIGTAPIAEAATWDSMLESVTMGWDAVGPPHDQTFSTG